jgi:hypothetical protein
MRPARLPLIAGVLAALAALHATPALAQRVFVAAQGSDANPCTFALPCRTFQHAHDTVAAGGEIDVLDPAGYGAVAISKAISIQGHGFSGISVGSGGTGITINAGATAAVSLNGLLIEGSGAGANGVMFNSGKSLVVANCAVRNLTGTGLAFVSNATTAQTLSVSQSYFTESNVGIDVETHSSGAVTVTIDRVGLYRNVIGLQALGQGGTGALDVAVTDSTAANNRDVGATGFFVQSDVGHSAARLVLTRSSAVGNVIGAASLSTNATLRLAASTVTGNDVGLDNSGGGVILTYGDNVLDGNVNNGGTLDPASRQ